MAASLIGCERKAVEPPALGHHHIACCAFCRARLGEQDGIYVSEHCSLSNGYYRPAIILRIASVVLDSVLARPATDLLADLAPDVAENIDT
jgi:hypothetical protein